MVEQNPKKQYKNNKLLVSGRQALNFSIFSFLIRFFLKNFSFTEHFSAVALSEYPKVLKFRINFTETKEVTASI